MMNYAPKTRHPTHRVKAHIVLRSPDVKQIFVVHAHGDHPEVLGSKKVSGRWGTGRSGVG